MIKIGMVGLDTSHCVAFTRILNDADDAYHIPGTRVVAAYPGGSDQFSLSRNRVRGFTEQLESDYGWCSPLSVSDINFRTARDQQLDA